MIDLRPGGIAHVHDLLCIDPQTAAIGEAPLWVERALRAAPWVVVRRAGCNGATIAIGIRGSGRAERFAATIDAGAVLAVRTPADLRVAACAGSSHRLARAARAIDAGASALQLDWGPAGAYGFELASGVPVTHAQSDLDIIVAGAASRAVLREFAAACAGVERATGVRIDAEVVLNGSGIALREFASDALSVLAKTASGPQLVTLQR